MEVPPGLAREDWPARARIRGLAPIGVGTADVESCSGLIVRVAAGNHLPVRRLVERVLVDLARAGAIPGIDGPDMRRLAADFMRAKGAAVNGAWQTASTWAGILEAVTLQPGIASTTLAAWADRLSNRALLREHRAFCPACLHDWAAAGRVAYEPLRWQFQVLEVCVEHEVWLRERCPNPECDRKRHVTAGWASTEYCTGCRTRLARPAATLRETEAPLTAESLDWARFVDEQLRDILARPPRSDAAEGEPFAELLAVAIETVTGGEQKAFARRIGMTDATVSYWKVGRRTPSLASMLRVCRAAGFCLRDVLLGDLAAVKASPAPVAIPYVAPSLESHHAFDHSNASEVLEAALRADPPPTLASVGKAASFNMKTIRRIHPRLCAAIRQRRAAWWLAEVAERERRRIAQIEAGVNELTRLGTYPSSRRLVEHGLIGAFWLRDSRYVEAWREAVVRAGWGHPSELHRRKGAPAQRARRKSALARREGS